MKFWRESKNQKTSFPTYRYQLNVFGLYKHHFQQFSRWVLSPRDKPLRTDFRKLAFLVFLGTRKIKEKRQKTLSKKWSAKWKSPKPRGSFDTHPHCYRPQLLVQRNRRRIVSRYKKIIITRVISKNFKMKHKTIINTNQQQKKKRKISQAAKSSAGLVLMKFWTNNG